MPVRNITNHHSFLIFGMHRSGTSALTKTIGILNSGLPKNLVAANESNPKGHWESENVVLLNNEILKACNSHMHDWSGLNLDRLGSERYAELKLRASSTILEEFQDPKKAMVLKDPRICRMPKFWLNVLNDLSIFPKLIICIRDPIETANSLTKRDDFDLEISVLIWLRYTLEAERHTRQMPRAIVCYDDLLSSWQSVVRGIEANLNIMFDKSEEHEQEINSFIHPSLRHNEASSIDYSPTISTNKMATKVYEILAAWTKSGEKSADYEILDEIYNEFEQVSIRSGELINKLRLRRKVSDLALAKERTEPGATIFGDIDELKETEALLIDEVAELITGVAGLRKSAFEISSFVQDYQSNSDLKSKIILLEEEVSTTRQELKDFKKIRETDSRDIITLQEHLEQKEYQLSVVKTVSLEKDRKLNQLLNENKTIIGFLDNMFSTNNHTFKSIYKHIENLNYKVESNALELKSLHLKSLLMQKRNRKNTWYKSVKEKLIRLRYRSAFKALHKNQEFDAIWYESHYEDVLFSSYSAEMHFILFGQKELRAKNQSEWKKMQVERGL